MRALLVSACFGGLHNHSFHFNFWEIRK
uniref:Uncharacterized protein n=1 Tax=Anguilla anguilla TaxID=7936 RepID=A0A0E9RMQ6_ANGAN